MFSKEIPRICAYCENGTPMQNGKHVLCPRKGVVTCDFTCKKFLYTPLRRVPKRRKSIVNEFDKSDFSIQ